jgi:hypothetical protein
LQKGILNYGGSGIWLSKLKMPVSPLLTRMNPEIWRKALFALSATSIDASTEN